MICKSGALTQDGSRSSSTRTSNLSTGRAAKSLTLKEARMRKVKQLEFGVTTEESTKNGKSSILTKQRDLKPRESAKISDSISTDHSTLSLNFHSLECLSATVPTMSGSRDGEITLEPNNGTSMESQRPSRTTTGSHTHLISNQTVDLAMSDVLPLTQDGGNSSDTKTVSL